MANDFAMQRKPLLQLSSATPENERGVIIDEGRINALNAALDELLGAADSPSHLYRKECPCRWCYRQRSLGLVVESTEHVA